MHWFGLTEIDWLAIIVLFLGAIVVERLSRIAILLDGIYTIMWRQTGGGN